MRHWTVRALVLLVALALSSPTAAGDAPQAPKLGGTPLPPAAAVPDDAPARSLPRTAAICQDATARRCWRAAREADCGATPGGRPYRLVIDSPADVAQALAQCSAALAETD